MKINRFEELESWQEARKLVKLVYQATSNQKFSKDFGLKDQIQRASISVMSNIAEGFGTRSDLEFIRFLDFAIRSCCEVQSQAYASFDVGYLGQEDFDDIYKRAQECSNLCKGFVRYLRKSKS